MTVFIAPTYKFVPAGEAETLPAEQPGVTMATLETPASEAPIDLDTALARLADELKKLDELIGKDRNFPAELAAIEAKHKTLTDQELDSVEAIEARSAQMSKISAMCELATVRQIWVESDRVVAVADRFVVFLFVKKSISIVERSLRIDRWRWCSCRQSRPGRPFAWQLLRQSCGQFLRRWPAAWISSLFNATASCHVRPYFLAQT
jgi:hypothetical protein